MPAFLAYHLRCRRRRKRPKICFPSAVLRGWRLWKPIVKHLVPQICQSDFERSTSFFNVKFRKDWWIYDISTSIKYLQVRYCWRFPFQTSVLSKHIDRVSGLPYTSNLRLQEWVTALFFLEAWLREVPFRRQNDDAKKAAAQALQQEAEELIVTWWSRYCITLHCNCMYVYNVGNLLLLFFHAYNTPVCLESLIRPGSNWNHMNMWTWTWTWLSKVRAVLSDQQMSNRWRVRMLNLNCKSFSRSHMFTHLRFWNNAERAHEGTTKLIDVS